MSVEPPSYLCAICGAVDTKQHDPAYHVGTAYHYTKSCKHENTYFDRTLCGIDDWMHTYCGDCGRVFDGECGANYKPLCESCHHEWPCPTRQGYGPRHPELTRQGSY